MCENNRPTCSRSIHSIPVSGKARTPVCPRYKESALSPVGFLEVEVSILGKAEICCIISGPSRELRNRMSTLPVQCDCRWEDQAAWESAGHLPSCAEAC